MQLYEYAQNTLELLRYKLTNLEKNDFFQENPQWKDLVPAAEAIAIFAISHPAMLINDVVATTTILDSEKGLLRGEYEEVRDAKEPVHKIDEIGDVGFFALLAGMIYWSELDEAERAEIIDSLTMVDQEAYALGSDLASAVITVAQGKDTINFPDFLLQLLPGEKTVDVPVRYNEMYPLLKKIRRALNGEWKDTKNLLRKLIDYTAEVGELSIDVSQLLTLAGVNVYTEQ